MDIYCFGLCWQCSVLLEMNCSCPSGPESIFNAMDLATGRFSSWIVRHECNTSIFNGSQFGIGIGCCLSRSTYTNGLWFCHDLYLLKHFSSPAHWPIPSKNQ